MRALIFIAIFLSVANAATVPPPAWISPEQAGLRVRELIASGNIPKTKLIGKVGQIVSAALAQSKLNKRSDAAEVAAAIVGNAITAVKQRFGQGVDVGEAIRSIMVSALESIAQFGGPTTQDILVSVMKSSFASTQTGGAREQQIVLEGIVEAATFISVDGVLDPNLLKIIKEAARAGGFAGDDVALQTALQQSVAKANAARSIAAANSMSTLSKRALAAVVDDSLLVTGEPVTTIHEF